MKNTYQIIYRFGGGDYMAIHENGEYVKDIYRNETPVRDRKTKEMKYRTNDLEKIGEELEKKGYIRIYSDIEKALKGFTREEKIAMCKQFKK